MAASSNAALALRKAFRLTLTRSSRRARKATWLGGTSESAQLEPETAGALAAAVCSAAVVVAMGLAVVPWFKAADRAARDVSDVRQAADVETER